MGPPVSSQAYDKAVGLLVCVVQYERCTHPQNSHQWIIFRWHILPDLLAQYASDIKKGLGWAKSHLLGEIHGWARLAANGIQERKGWGFELYKEYDPTW